MYTKIGEKMSRKKQTTIRVSKQTKTKIKRLRDQNRLRSLDQTISTFMDMASNDLERELFLKDLNSALDRLYCNESVQSLLRALMLRIYEDKPVIDILKAIPSNYEPNGKDEVE